MGQKIQLDDKEYDIENVSDRAQKVIGDIQFVNRRIQELKNMQSLLRCAKNTYIESLKQEMVSNKAGFLIGDE